METTKWIEQMRREGRKMKKERRNGGEVKVRCLSAAVNHLTLTTDQFQYQLTRQTRDMA